MNAIKFIKIYATSVREAMRQACAAAPCSLLNFNGKFEP